MWAPGWGERQGVCVRGGKKGWGDSRMEGCMGGEGGWGGVDMWGKGKTQQVRKTHYLRRTTPKDTTPQPREATKREE